jgi:hypothetical protein
MVLYLLLAADLETVTEEANPNASMHHCNCAMHEGGTGLFAASSHPVATLGATDMRHSSSNSIRETSSEILPTTSQTSPGQGHKVKRAGSRPRVAKALIAVSNCLSTPAQDQFDLSWFKRGKARNYPEVPGEALRNRMLTQVRGKYNQSRDADGNVTPVLRGSHSRAGSFTSTVPSGIGVEDNSTTPTAASFPSPFVPPPIPRRPHAATLPAEQPSFKLQNFPSSTSASATGGRLRQRGDLLEVPSHVHNSPTRNNPSASTVNSIVNIPNGQSSPAIMISSDPSTSSSAHAPVCNPPASSLPSEPLPTPSMLASPPSL